MKDLGLLIFGVVTGAVTAAMIFTFFVRSPQTVSLRPASSARHAMKSLRAVKTASREVASLHNVSALETTANDTPPLVTSPVTAPVAKITPKKSTKKKPAPVRHTASVEPASTALPAPTFTATFPEKLETNAATEIRIAWNKVEGAKEYFLFVEDARGNMIKKYSTTHTDTTVQIPAPDAGEGNNYRLRVVAVNQGDLEGEKGEPRKMTVVRRNSALAPSLKQITIEE